MTHPYHGRRYRLGDRGTYALTVTQAQALAGTALCQGPKRLMGWSLSSGSAASLQAQGAVTSPAAAATIVAIPAAGNLPAGRWEVDWTVNLQGAAAAADSDNFQLRISGQNTASLNPGAAGEYPQESLVIDTNGATNARIIAIAAGTVGVTYSAQLTLTPRGGQGQLFDGAQLVGIPATDGGNTDTQIMADDGVLIASALSLTMIDGVLSGCVWIRDLICDD